MGSILRPFQNLLSPGKFQVPSGLLAIDGSSSLANGLIACFVPGVTVGRDLTGNMPTNMTFQSAAGFDQTREGAALKSTVSSSGMTLTAPSSLKTWTQLTLWWRGYLNASPNINDLAIGISYDNAGSSPFAIALIQYASATQFGIAWNNGGSFLSTMDTLPSLPAIVDLVATFVVGGSVTPYVNGAIGSGGAVSFGSSYNTSATSTLQIGADIGTVTRNAHGYTNIAAIWNRALSASEVMALYLDPYGFFLPAESEMPAVTAATAVVHFRRSLSPIGTRVGARQAVQ